MGVNSTGFVGNFAAVLLRGLGSGFAEHSVDIFADQRVGKEKGPRVLVVDDEKLVADSLSAILNRFNFNAAPFYSGESAIEAAREKCPDYVLSDVMMPKLNGVETVLMIKKFCPTARVILLSGHAATADLLNEARLKGYEFELLAKPIHPDELLRRLV
ncbi:MAG TPA: response regulator [Terriglobales bacterium]|nr:response regulator [Terriglobales bacterium]